MQLYSKCFITCIPHTVCSFNPYVLCPVFTCISVAMETDSSDVTISDLHSCEVEGSDSDTVENSSFIHQQPLHLLMFSRLWCVCVRAYVALSGPVIPCKNPCLNYETPSVTTRYFLLLKRSMSDKTVSKLIKMLHVLQIGLKN
jgi:hypothetical protein